MALVVEVSEEEKKEDYHVFATELSNIQCAHQVCITVLCLPCGAATVREFMESPKNEKKPLPAEITTVLGTDVIAPPCFLPNTEPGSVSVSNNELAHLIVGFIVCTITGLIGGYF